MLLVSGFICSLLLLLGTAWTTHSDFVSSFPIEIQESILKYLNYQSLEKLYLAHGGRFKGLVERFSVPKYLVENLYMRSDHVYPDLELDGALIDGNEQFFQNENFKSYYKRITVDSLHTFCRLLSLGWFPTFSYPLEIAIKGVFSEGGRAFEPIDSNSWRILDFIVKTYRVTALTLCVSGICNPDSLSKLANVIRESRLISLNLGFNRIGSEFPEFSQALATMSKLQILELQGNGIRIEGFTALLHALAGKHIKYLGLNSNDIDLNNYVEKDVPSSRVDYLDLAFNGQDLKGVAVINRLVSGLKVKCLEIVLSENVSQFQPGPTLETLVTQASSLTLLRDLLLVLASPACRNIFELSLYMRDMQNEAMQVLLLHLPRTIRRLQLVQWNLKPLVLASFIPVLARKYATSLERIEVQELDLSLFAAEDGKIIHQYEFEDRPFPTIVTIGPWREEKFCNALDLDHFHRSTIY